MAGVERVARVPFCHTQVTNTNGHRAEYEDQGWLIAAWRVSAEQPVWRLPSTVPVHLAGVGRVLLNDDGGYELVLGDVA